MNAEVLLVANARIPSERAQTLQVVQMAAAFARAGAETTLVHARRARVLALPPGTDAWDYYRAGPPCGAPRHLEAVPCLDWIDHLPRALQFLPARLQELTFARAAARAVLARRAPAGRASFAYVRDAEAALSLTRRRHPRVFLEIHRVPGGRTRRRWLREAAAGARGVVAISGGVRADLERLGVAPAAITVEHDGFAAERFGALAERAEARRALGLDATRVLVVYTGSLIDWKGVDLLVEAARELGELDFAVAGGMPEDVARLRARARGLANVRIDGFQPPERVALYLAAADLGVVPNRSTPAISGRYTSPLKVFEAMAAGLPLVASDVPALRELLSHGEDAWLVAPDEPRALAAGIRALAGDAALRARFAKHFRARASAHTWDARARRLLAWMGERSA
jgi:glycosyltransferase involved in cell wall biosynthesis